MSAFDTSTPAPTGEDITENFLEHLVGDGKKFADPEALAKGKYEADKFVEDLKRRNAELQEDIDKSAKIDEMMELIRTQNKTVKEPEVKPVDPSDTSSDHMTPEELKALIASHVDERETQATAAKNLAEADKALVSKFGDAAGSVLTTKAAELGMSVDQMKEVASNNPKAFFRLVGMDVTTTPSSSLVGGSQRSEAASTKSGDARDWAYYQNLRRKAKTKYHSVAVQNQMMEDLEAQGAEAFYGNN